MENRLIDFQINVVRGFKGLIIRLDEISEKLDKLIELQGAEAQQRNNPQEEARRWFRRHFCEEFEGDGEEYLDYMTAYEHPRSREDAGGYIADMCDVGLLKEEDACTTECARHAMALMRISGKCSPDYLRRAISAAIHHPEEEPEA